MRLIFNDQTFSFELLRTLSYAPYGGADIGECLLTAYRIKEGDFESWHQEWMATATRVHALADAALNAEQRTSAREAYLRASNYYRTAEFFLHGDTADPRLLSTWRLSQDTFRSATALMDIVAERVEIPYEGITMPGYFYRADASREPRPTLIVHGGYDSTGEELYFNGIAALQRGYNCLTFEGPGQGTMIREHGIPFRTDWEQVITPVVDFLLNRPETDPQRLALMGISFGGHLAPRAAAFEHRLAACVANDGLFSFKFSEMGKKSLSGQPLDEANFEQAMQSLLKQHTGVRWAIENGLFTFRAESLPELMEKTESYTLEGIAEQITCPTFVCAAEEDHFFKGEPERLYEALTCPKTFFNFSAEDGAEEHCHFGALTFFNHHLFAWLDETLRIHRPALF